MSGALHVCTVSDVESAPPAPTPDGKKGSVRECALSMWSVVKMAQSIAFKWTDEKQSSCTNPADLGALLWYGATYPSRGKRRVPMDVPKLVEAWTQIIMGLAVAHDKAEVDRCEFDAETHLAPLLTAPVKQIREFYAALVAALKADKRAPYFLWAMCDAYHEVIVKNAPDGEVVQLKTALAEEIAQLVEKDVAPDLPGAIAAALRWRPTEQLEQVRDAVKSGHGRPRLKGRESCLFLSVGEGPQEVLVML